MLKNQIEIDGHLVEFKASAAVPRMYRLKFGRDIFKDLTKIAEHMKEEENEAKEKGTNGSSLPIEDLELFENASYIMAKHADPSIPNSIEEWLERFNTFSIYQILPQIMELWSLNVQTDVENKKKLSQLSGK